MERLDHQDHCRILQEDSAMGDVSSMTTKYCAPSNAAANWRREKAGPDMSMCYEIEDSERPPLAVNVRRRTLR
jgi:hypothetical protein